MVENDGEWEGMVGNVGEHCQHCQDKASNVLFYYQAFCLVSININLKI